MEDSLLAVALPVPDQKFVPLPCDEDRPGQRSAFGKGYNPPAAFDERPAA